MKTLAMVGVLLYVVGVAAFLYQGIAYMTRKNLIGIARFRLPVKKTGRPPMGVIVGCAALACGIIMLVVGFNKT